MNPSKQKMCKNVDCYTQTGIPEKRADDLDCCNPIVRNILMNDKWNLMGILQTGENLRKTGGNNLKKTMFFFPSTGGFHIAKAAIFSDTGKNFPPFLEIIKIRSKCPFLLGGDTGI